MDILTPPTLDDAGLNLLGQRIFGLWPTHRDDRKQIEERWLQNLYQFRKIYGAKVLSMIPADRSKAYPGITQWMVRGTIARLMQMLWPMTEKNYGIRASKLPDLSTEQLQKVLDVLELLGLEVTVRSKASKSAMGVPWLEHHHSQGSGAFAVDFTPAGRRRRSGKRRCGRSTPGS